MPWRGPEYDGEFPSLGWGIVAWAEERLVVPDGPGAGRPLRLADWQVEYLVRRYRVDPVGGRLVYRRAVVVRAKGAGKSPLLAVESAAQLAGPVVPDGWDAAGEPVGRAHPSPWVQVAAVSEDATDNSWLWLLGAVRHEASAFGADLGWVDAGETRILTPAGRAEPVTASAGSRTGQRITAAVLEETWLWLRRNRGHALAATLRANLAKGDGVSTEVTNVPRTGEGSVAEDSIRHARGGAAGVMLDWPTGPEVSLRWKERGEPPSPTALANLRRAVARVYAGSPWVVVDRIVDEVCDPATTVADATRLYLNREAVEADAWLPRARWDAVAVPGEGVAGGEPVALGFDGSRWDDSTALVACRLSDGHLHLVGLWERPDGPAGADWEVPRAEVDAAVAGAFARWRVARFYADPPMWQAEVADWAARHGGAVAEWWTHRERAMVAAVERLRTAVLAGQVTHDGDARLAEHVGNARTTRRGAGLLLRKESPRSPRKIDAAVAAVLAYEARADALAAGWGRRGRRVVGRVR